MKKKIIFVATLVMVLAFGMTVVGCEGETEDDPPITYITWRSEITYDTNNTGRWISGTYSQSDYKQLFFDNRWTTGSNPSEAQVRAGEFGAGYDYKLISKDDKPANEESSFTIKASSGAQYTIKYKLISAGSIQITDIGGIDEGSDNFQNHIAVATYNKPE
jgi:hypothetical protein